MLTNLLHWKFIFIIIFVKSFDAIKNSLDICNNSPTNCSCNHIKNKIMIKCSNLEYYEELSTFLYSLSKTSSQISLQLTNSTNVINNLNVIPFSLPLESLSLSFNNIKIANLSIISDFKHLHSLNLSNNDIEELYIYSLESLKILDLRNNSLKILNISEILEDNKIEEIYLSNNKLTTLLYTLPLNKTLKSLWLSGNSWNCDTKIDTFLNSSQDLIKDLNEAKCDTPLNRKNLTWARISFVIKTETCRICDCYISDKRGIIVNCTAKGLKKIPSTLPRQTKVVYLNDNSIKDLSFSPGPINWENVRDISLQNNEIIDLQGIEQPEILSKLISLNVKNNRLKHIPYHILEQLSSLEEIYFGENHWICECNIIKLKSWLEKNANKVRDLDSITCYNNLVGSHSVNLPIHKIPLADLCPQPKRPIEYLDTISITLTILTALILLKLIYDWYWQKRTGKLPLFFRLNY